MIEDTSNNIPQMRTPEQIRWDTLRPYLLDPRENYPEPYHILEFNEADSELSAVNERTVKRF